MSIRVRELVETLGLEVKVGEEKLDSVVEGGYVSDLLSDVIAHSQKGDLWITLQVHQNIVAVAALKELAGIVVIGDKKPAEDTVERAKTENVVILTSSLPAFELSGRLYEMGLRGSE